MKKVVDYIKLIVSDKLLLSIFSNGFLYAYAIVVIKCDIYKVLTPKIMAINTIIYSILSVKVNNYWKKKGYCKRFKLLLFIESMVSGTALLLFYIFRDGVMFYLIDMLSSVIIYSSIQCTMDIVKAAKYEGGCRADFDKDVRSVGSIATCLGSIAVLVKPPCFEIGLIILFIAAVCDNMMQYSEFKKYMKL